MPDTRLNPTAPDDPAHAVTTVLTRGISDGVFPGAVVWAACRGDCRLHLAAGSRTLFPAPLATTRHTLFDLASLTKPMVTMSVLMAIGADAGLTPDRPVSDIIPEFGHGSSTRAGVTVGRLLSHTSGLPAWRPFFDALAEAANPYQAVIAHICNEPLQSPPGKQAVYSDLGYILLGEALIRATQTPLDRLFADHVATPLGLRHTGFNPGNQANSFAPQPVAATLDCPRRQFVLCGQVHDDNAWFMGGVCGHAGLFGTAEDVGRWGQALLNACRGDASWLSPDTVRGFLAGPTTPASGWVYGMDTPTPPSSAGRHFGPRAVGHLGYTGTSVWIDLEKEWVAVLLTNRLHPEDQGTDGIRRFRPMLHDSVARVLMAAPGPVPAG